MAQEKKIEILFTKSPTGRYGLAHSDGDKVALPAAQAKQIIEDGYALTVADAKAKAKKEAQEKAAKQKGKKA